MQAVQKPILRYKRQGRVCTLFIDPTTDRPQSISHFDDEPPAFPKRMTEDEIFSHFGGQYQLVAVDNPNVPPPVEVDAVVDEAALEQIRDAGDKATAQYKLKHGITGDARQERIKGVGGLAVAPSAPVATPPTPPIPAQGNSTWATRVYQELETLFAKRSVATGKLKKEISAEVNAICNFLLRVEPEIKPILVDLSERHKQQERVEF